MADRIVRRASVENPGVYYTLHLSHANSLLLPRTDTVWEHGGFRIENRSVYGECLVLPLELVDDETIQAAPMVGLPVAPSGDMAYGYIGDLTSGEIRTVVTEAPR